MTAVVRDILALQSEVASAIAGEISLKLSPEKNARLAAAHPWIQKLMKNTSRDAISGISEP